MFKGFLARPSGLSAFLVPPISPLPLRPRPPALPSLVKLLETPPPPPAPRPSHSLSASLSDLVCAAPCPHPPCSFWSNQVLPVPAAFSLPGGGGTVCVLAGLHADQGLKPATAVPPDPPVHSPQTRLPSVSCGPQTPNVKFQQETTHRFYAAGLLSRGELSRGPPSCT